MFLGNIDVTDRQRMEKFIVDVDKSSPVDLVIANAGITEETSGTTGDIVAATRKLYAVNVEGVFNSILPLVPRMQVRVNKDCRISRHLKLPTGGASCACCDAYHWCRLVTGAGFWPDCDHVQHGRNVRVAFHACLLWDQMRCASVRRGTPVRLCLTTAVSLHMRCLHTCSHSRTEPACVGHLNPRDIHTEPPSTTAVFASTSSALVMSNQT